MEDNASVREGLTMILNGSHGFECVGSCDSAEEALRVLPALRPDVTLMDINLPRRSGIECVRQIRGSLPQMQIIMLTIEEDSRRVFESLEAGANGYLVKNVPPAMILTAIEEVQRGGSPMSSQIARMVVQSFRRNGPSTQLEENLTSREQEVLSLVAKGYRTKEVGDALSISPQTVETHLRNIYSKLHVRSRAAAVARFIQR